MAAQDNLSPDQFPHWRTEHLHEIAHRVTPRDERPDWIATSGDLDEPRTAWLPKRDARLNPTGAWGKYQDGRVIDEMDDADMRVAITEQLQHYGVDEHQVNMMRS